MPKTIDLANYDVGVIVGRFQIPSLHSGHRALIDFALERHRKVIVVLGLAATNNTTNNPLDFESRRQMIQDIYPQVVCLYVKDIPSDELWSKSLDGVVGDVISPTQTAIMYGSRDSFIDSYTGKYDCHELLQEGYLTGTQIRNKVRQESRNSEDFRAGVIWASANRYPTVYTCVDVAIFNNDFSKIALGRKPYEDQWRLIGGFSDPNGNGFEHDAYREVAEETKMGLISLKYLGSFAIDDWRYAKEPDQIKSLLFRGTTTDKGRAADDIGDLEWFDTETVRNWLDKMIVKCHRPLMVRALEGI